MAKDTLLIGASGGIGAALSKALEPGRLVTLSRSADGLDITDETSIKAAAARLTGPFVRIIDATGALEIDGRGPEKSLSEVDPEAFARQFALNATGPALLLKHFAPLMASDGPTVFVSLSARVGSIGDNHLGGWYSYRAAKAALNQILRTASIEMRRHNRQSVVAALHPGTVATPLTQRYLGRHKSVAPEEAAQNLLAVIARLQPEHSGGFFDYAMQEIMW